MQADELTGDDPDLVDSIATRRLRRIAIVLSVALHVAGLSLLRWVAPPPRARSVSVIDIETAPLAPLAETLPPEDPARDEPTPAATEPEAPEVPEVPPPVDDRFGVVDAGVPVDAMPVDAVPVDARPRVDAAVPLDAAEAVALDDLADAGPGDGGLVAAADDAGPDDGDGGLVAAAGGDGGGDGGPVTTAGGDGDGGGDGGPVTTAGGDGDGDGGVGDGDGGRGVAGADLTGNPAAKPSAGTAANLLDYFPGGHVVTVMVRLDRLRDTEWAERVDGLLRPLPDHRSLVGDSDLKLADSFDLLVVSSPQPENAAATTLVGRTRMTPAELRDFIDQPDAPVAWSPVRGGALGRRRPSPRVFPGDRRVFLSWRPGWMVLTQPADLGGLTAGRGGALDLAARPADLPPWLARVSTISDESGEPTGPALMVTAGGMFGDRLPLLGPGGASVPAPDRATVTIELDPKGFIVRGNLRYADDSAAATANDAIVRLRAELLDQYGSLPVLSGFPLLTVLRGLTVQRTGRRLAFATSASIADARALLDLASALVSQHFEQQQQQRRPARPVRPVRPVRPPAPAPRPAP